MCAPIHSRPSLIGLTISISKKSFSLSVTTTQSLAAATAAIIVSSALQSSEWHGNTVHAFALTGAVAADYVITVLIGTLNGAQVDSKSEKSTKDKDELFKPSRIAARDMSGARLSHVLSIGRGQQCRPCPPFPDLTRARLARESARRSGRR